MAKGRTVTVLNHHTQTRTVTEQDDPLETVAAMSRAWRPVAIEGMPRVFTGGWAGYCGYDTVRYVYAGTQTCSVKDPGVDMPCLKERGWSHGVGAMCHAKICH